MSDFQQCSNQIQRPNFTFGQFSAARKPIRNGGAIRPTGLLLVIISKHS